jgi:hypothetical protein
MPKNKPFSELSKKEKMSKAKKARTKAEKTLSGPTKSMNRSERAKATRAKQAAMRVEKRLSGDGGGMSRSAATKPGKGAVNQALSALSRLGTFMGKAVSGKLASQETKELKKVKNKSK